jgi:two-component system nitrogen regulation response regulator GlnG
MPNVLVIDDDRTVLHLVKETLKAPEITVNVATNATDGLNLLQQHRPDVVLLDILLPEASGLEIFERIRKIDHKLPVIFITATGNSDTAIEAMKLGAFDYLSKPLDVHRIRDLVHQGLEMRRLMNVPVGLPDHGELDDGADVLVGRSSQMLDVYKSIGRVAPQDVTVLIRGESGTGKELIARAIYHHSSRTKGPFLAVNCAAIPDALLESELFGHEKGSFTSAERRRIGKFEQCSGGTIFLDEVGDMSPLVQSKLLRVLQEQRFERVGGDETIKTDVRIIAATNRDLEDMVSEGTFRADLYYRLNGFTIKLPPLRDRGDDIKLLMQTFLARYSHQMHKELQHVAPEAERLLLEYPWPGNVREMQNVLRKALLQTVGPVLLSESLPEEIRTGGVGKKAPADGDLPPADLASYIDERLQAKTSNLYAESVEMMERYLITRVLRLTGGNQSKAAAMLGITRGSLRNKIHVLGISIGQVVHIEEDSAEGAATPA